MTTESDMSADSPTEVSQAKPSLFRRIGDLFKGKPPSELVVPTSTPVELETSVRIGRGMLPFVLTLGKIPMEFHLDLPIAAADRGASLEWIVHAGRAYYEKVPEFVRISPGDDVVFGRGDETQSWIFGFDRSVSDRHVRISNKAGTLTIHPLATDRSTTIGSIANPISLRNARRDNVMRLPDVLGRPLVPFGDDEALGVIREINEIHAAEAYRELNDEGMPGGIVKFPNDMAVVVVGDLHARVDNLLRIIIEGGLLTRLERGNACILMLGDLVHAELDEELEDMDSSVFMLDVYCMLKRRFPKNIFYLHGNHESFSPEVGKGGVPQGLLLRKHLKKRRGMDYVREVEKLFDGLAYIAQGNEFAACHGAPVRSRVTRESLVNIRHYPGLQAEVVWNRLRQPNRPAGYGKGSVRRFRRTLELSKDATLLVGHTPMSTTETMWRDIGGIAGHHIVYSAHPHRLAIMEMRHGRPTPMELAPEPVLQLLASGLVSAEKRGEEEEE
jgi:hypothetical protein